MTAKFSQTFHDERFLKKKKESLEFKNKRFILKGGENIRQETFLPFPG